jgi:hypothetical protein
MKITDQRKEEFAADLKSQGYLIIRAYRRSYPDLIALKPDAKMSVVAYTVKPVGEVATAREMDAKAELEEQGIDVSFRYIPVRPAKRNYLPNSEKERHRQECFEAGRQAFKDNIPRKHWPRHEEKYRAAWYRQKWAWLNGWDDAKENQ